MPEKKTALQNRRAEESGISSNNAALMVAQEQRLIELLGEADLKEICEELAEVVRKHNLHKRPYICSKLFSYMSSVIKGWNCV